MAPLPKTLAGIVSALLLIESARAEHYPECGLAQMQALYFGNGIWAGSEDEEYTAWVNALQDHLSSRLSQSELAAICPKVAYNRSVSKTGDLLEAVRQVLGNEYPMLLIGALLDLAGLPRFFIPQFILQQVNDYLRAEVARKLIQGQSSEADIATQVAEYRVDIGVGRKIVVVSHSQGNLFVNLAFLKLTDVEQTSFAMVPVASPDSLARRSLVGHVTFTNDRVIEAIQIARTLVGLPPPLQPYDFAEQPGTGWAHYFSEDYLADTSAEQFIVGGIITSFSLLPPPTQTIPTFGAVVAAATLDANRWPLSGTVPLSYRIACPNRSIAGLAVPSSTENIPTGACTIAYNNGGPPNGTFVGISPCQITSPPSSTCTQTLSSNQILTFTMQFRSTNQPPTAGFMLTSDSQTATEGQDLHLTVPPGRMANVNFSANRSSDPDGTMVGWEWRINNTLVSSASSFAFGLGAGNHVITLVVTDNRGGKSAPAQGGIVVTESLMPTTVMYKVTDLGPGTAFAINNSGVVAGSQGPSVNSHAFFWSSSTGLKDLGSLAGLSYSQATAINDSNQVVGWAALTSVGEAMKAFVSTSGGPLVQLTTPSGTEVSGWSPQVSATGINSAGKIVGRFRGRINGVDTQDVFIFSGGAMRFLGTNQSINMYPTAINSRDHVAGQCTGRACVYRDGQVANLGALGGTWGVASSMNDNSDIVGQAGTANDSTLHAFFYSDGVMQDMGALAGHTYSGARGVNSFGVVVGYSATAAGGIPRAVLWSPTLDIFDLNDKIPANSGWFLSTAYAINDAGQIVGSGQLNGQWHAFLLTPQ